MEKLTIVKTTAVLAMVVLGYTNLWGQAPATVTVTPSDGNSTTLDKFVAATPGEDPDLITTGTTVPYLVYPDADLNPSWVAGADAKNTTNLVSDFNWTIPGTIGTGTPVKHYVEIAVSGAASATGSITVAEQSGASCPGSNSSIAVQIVAQPTITSASVTDGAAPLNSQCAPTGGTDGSLNIAAPTFSIVKTSDAAITGDPSFKVVASLTVARVPSGSATIFTDQICNVDNTTGNITLPTGTDLDYWGEYTLTISSISDRISRKDVTAANGYFTNGATTVTYTVSKAPVTGPIYHINNTTGM